MSRRNGSYHWMFSLELFKTSVSSISIFLLIFVPLQLTILILLFSTQFELLLFIRNKNMKGEKTFARLLPVAASLL